jgi:hypothetical protein
MKVISKPKTATAPAAVTSQQVQPGTGPVKVKIKIRLVADDDPKLTTLPKSCDNGPIVLATGVQGQAPPMPTGWRSAGPGVRVVARGNTSAS